MRRTWPLLFLLPALAVTAWILSRRHAPQPLPTAQTLVAGAISDAISVQQGAASYSMSLAVPPGTNGMQPALSLAYDTGQGNGFIGVGFHLKGISAITRCGAQIVSDNMKGGVSYTGSDRFCLNGQRLVLIGTYQGNPEYRTQNESWKRIVSQGTCGSGPCFFSVQRGDGTSSTFGLTGGSAILAQGLSGAAVGSRRAWMQDTVTDPNGNTMSFVYTQNPRTASGTSDQTKSGQVYLDHVSYGPAGGLSDSRTIQFTYDDKRPDAILHYEGGGVIQTNLRLKQIQSSIHPAVCAGGACAAQPVMTYTLAYGQAPNTGRSLLASVTQCAASGACLQPTTFTWTPGANTLLPQADTTSISGNTKSFVGDFNGDGLTDILGVSANKLYLSSGSGFPSSLTVCFDLSSATRLQFGDFNGDGITDIFGASSTNNGNLYFGGGSAPFSASSSSCTCPGPTCSVISKIEATDYLLSGDFNGDGLTDLLAVGSPGGKLYLSQGSSFALGNSTPGLSLGPGITPFIADFNGDGRADVLVVGTNSGTLYFSSETNNSDTTLSAGVPLGSGTQLQGQFRWVGDFNNDGIADLMVGNQVAQGTASAYINYGTGNGLSAGPPLYLTLMQNNYLGDFNGDGLPDIYATSGTAGTLYLGDGMKFTCVGSGTSCTSISASVSSGESYLGDFNGDGLTDIFTAQTGASKFNWATQGQALATRNQAAEMLATIVDGQGGQTAFSYAPITDSSAYEVTSGGSSTPNSLATGIANLYAATPLAPSLVQPYPVQAQRLGRFVVAKYEQSQKASINAAPGYDYSYTFFYQNAALNLLGRGWLGFETVTRTDPQLGARVTSDYRQDFPFVSRLSTQRTCAITSGKTCDTGSGTPLQTASATWTCMDSQSHSTCMTSNNAYNPQATQVFYVEPQSTTSADATLGTAVSTQYSFDNWGNLVQIAALGDKNGPSVPLYTCKSYFPADATNWIFGYVQYRKQTTLSTCMPNLSTWQAQGDLRLEQFAYDAKWNRTERLFWDDQHGGWLGVHLTFTPQGLPATATEMSGSPPADVAGTKYIATYDPAFTTFIASVKTPDPKSGGGPLTESFAYDARFGAQVSRKDPNGNIVNHCVDDFGRPAGMQGPILGGAAASPNCVNTTQYPYIDAAFTGNANLVTSSTVAYVYDPVGASVSVVDRALDTWTGSDWTQQTQVLDGLGRTIQVNAQNDTGTGLTTQVVYQDESHVQKESLPALASSTLQWVSYQYDAVGRMQRRTRPTWDVAGNLAQATDTWTYGPADTISVTFASEAADAATQVRSLQYYGPKARVHRATIAGATTTIDYDGLARIQQVTSPVPQSGPAVVDSVIRDSVGRVRQRSNTGTGTRTYHFDAHGLPHDQIDAMGRKLVFAWDPLHRLTSQEMYGSRSELEGSLVLAYDAPANGSYKNTAGRLATAAVKRSGEVEIVTDYGYDTWGRATSQDVGVDSTVLPFGIDYDPQGRPWTRTYPGANGTRPQARFGFWSGNGALRSVEYAADGKTFASWLALSQYSPTRQPGSAAYGTGAGETWGYLQNGLPSSHVVTTDAGNTRLVNDALGWTENDEISSILDCNYAGNSAQAACAGRAGTSQRDGSATYGYTALRLTSETSAQGRYTYCYDGAGNRTLGNGVVFGYAGNQVQTGKTAQSPAACNSAAGAEVWNAQYDAAGEMTSRTAAQTTVGFTYGANGWLMQTKVGAQLSERFAYDHHGRRVVKIVYRADGTTVDHAVLYPAPDYEVTLQNGGTAAYTVYLTNAAGRFAAISGALPQKGVGEIARKLGIALNPGAAPAAARSLVFHKDQVGSTKAVTDGSGNGYASVTYDPWGTPSISPAANNAFRPLFGGKEYSQKTGLYYFESRYFDPFTGRFATADTQAGAGPLVPDAWNRYAFALNSPLVNSDPTGHTSVKVYVAIGAVVVVAIAASAALWYLGPEVDCMAADEGVQVYDVEKDRAAEEVLEEESVQDPTHDQQSVGRDPADQPGIPSAQNPAPTQSGVGQDRRLLSLRQAPPNAEGEDRERAARINRNVDKLWNTYRPSGYRDGAPQEKSLEQGKFWGLNEHHYLLSGDYLGVEEMFKGLFSSAYELGYPVENKGFNRILGEISIDEYRLGSPGTHAYTSEFSSGIGSSLRR